MAGQSGRHHDVPAVDAGRLHPRLRQGARARVQAQAMRLTVRAMATERAKRPVEDSTMKAMARPDRAHGVLVFGAGVEIRPDPERRWPGADDGGDAPRRPRRGTAERLVTPPGSQSDAGDDAGFARSTAQRPPPGPPAPAAAYVTTDDLSMGLALTPITLGDQGSIGRRDQRRSIRPRPTNPCSASVRRSPTRPRTS